MMKEELERLAKEAYPDITEKLYPTKEQFIAEKARLIVPRAGFIKGYLASY